MKASQNGWSPSWESFWIVSSCAHLPTFLKRNNKCPTISLVTNDNMSRCSQIGARMIPSMYYIHKLYHSSFMLLESPRFFLKGTIKQKHDLNGLVHQPPSVISPPFPNSLLNFHSRRGMNHISKVNLNLRLLMRAGILKFKNTKWWTWAWVHIAQVQCSFFPSHSLDKAFGKLLIS